MSKWMCDIKGEQISSEKDMEKLVEDVNSYSLTEFINKKGNLCENIQNYIKQLGYKISDIGGGRDSWHIGVPFDDFVEATNYLYKVSNAFKYAISSGLIWISLKTWTEKSWKELNDKTNE